MKELHLKAHDILVDLKIVTEGQKISPQVNDPVKIRNLKRNYKKVLEQINQLTKTMDYDKTI